MHCKIYVREVYWRTIDIPPEVETYRFAVENGCNIIEVVGYVREFYTQDPYEMTDANQYRIIIDDERVAIYDHENLCVVQEANNLINYNDSFNYDNNEPINDRYEILDL